MEKKPNVPETEEVYDVKKKMIRSIPEMPEHTIVQHPGIPTDWLVPSTSTIPDYSESDTEQINILTGRK